MSSRKIIKNLFRKYQIRPSKKLGQNFLIDKKVLKKIIEAAEIKASDVILEIGPGMGNLTVELSKRAGRVIAIEKDPKMVEVLKETLKDFQNIEIIKEDIRKFPISNFQFPIYKVVANIPYYLTSVLIRKFLAESGVRPCQLVLMVQKEVAQRICAQIPDMNLLAVSVQFYAQPKIISFVSKKSFWPQPKVDSAIIRIDSQMNTDRKQMNADKKQMNTDKKQMNTDRKQINADKKQINVDKKQINADKKQMNTDREQINTDLFFKIVRAGFSQPRKQLINNFLQNLTKYPPGEKVKLKEKIKKWLLENNIQPTQRAETLTLKDWLKLTKNYKIK